MKARLIAVLCVASLICAAPHLAHGQVQVGAMGDSITDEWSNIAPTGTDWPYATAGIRNWVEFAEQTGKLDFGTYTAFTLVSGTQEVRRAGADRSSYWWNFARGGASTEANGLGAFNTFFSKSYTQTPPVPPGAQQNFRTTVNAGLIDYGVMIIGGNDFLAGMNVFTYFKDAPSTDPQNTVRLDNMINNVRTALLQSTGAPAGGTPSVKMVLGDLFDLGNALQSAGLTAQQQANVRDNVLAWNTRIDNLAQTLFAQPMPVVSLYDWWEDAKAGQTVVHGIPILASPAPNSAIAPDKSVDLTDWNHLVLPDGVHPAPIGAALLADRYIRAIRDGYGETDVTPYTSKELVTLTGLDPQDAPVADGGLSYAIDAHQQLVLDASASYDPDVGDAPYLQFSWDVNGDGIFGDATGISPVLSWSQLADLGINVVDDFDVRVRVDDSFGGVTDSAAATLSVTALPGDVNLDANVDIFDVGVVSDHWEQAGPEGDANGDGSVDIFDVGTISDHWTAGGAQANAVPEPGAWALSIYGALLTAIYRGFRSYQSLPQ